MPQIVNLYLKKKRARVGNKHYLNTKADMEKFKKYFKGKKIGHISRGDLDDFFNDGPLTKLSSKTRANIRATVSDFFSWCLNYGFVGDIPQIPTVKYKLGWRKTISKEQQEAILKEVEKICPDPKVGLALKFLCTYVNVRPGELVKIIASDSDFEQKRILLRGKNNKEGHDKYVYLLEEDVELLKSYTQPCDNELLFTKRNGKKFGRDYLYRWWKRACDNLGIEGVDLYGGTRHSTVIYLRSLGYTPEEIKRASMHSTNKAFERYLQLTPEEVTPIYQATRL